MKAKFIVMSLLAIFCLTVNAQTVNTVETAAKKEAVKGAQKEAVKGAKKEAVKAAKKEAVKGAQKEAVKAATKETVVKNAHVACREDRAAVKASASKKELKSIKKAAKKNNK